MRILTGKALHHVYML